MGIYTPNMLLYKPSIGAGGAEEKALFDAGLDQVDAAITALSSLSGLTLLIPGGGENTTIIDGDVWLTANANYVDGRWYRLDETKVAFGLELKGKNNIPGETMQGAVLWTAAANQGNPIGLTFGATGGWELGWAITSFRDFVVGGVGIEVDGHGTIPYGRVIHSNQLGAVHTGILSNLYADFSGKDVNADPCWFAGRCADSFKIRRLAGSAAISDGNFTTLFHIDSTGNVRIGNTPALFISTGNKIGIGTITPLTPLEIQDGLTTTGAILTLSSKEPTPVINDILGRINFRTAEPTLNYTAASIVAVVEETFDTTFSSTGLAFYTSIFQGVPTEYMRISHHGSVGIGTEAPGGKLDLCNGIFILSNTNVNHGMTLVTPTNAYGQIGPIASSTGGLGLMGFSDTDATALTIVGVIGTDNPTDSKSVIDFSVMKKNGTGAQALGASETAFQFWNYLDPLVTILGDGKVGIGTISPTNKLSVVGNINISGNLITAGSSLYSGFGYWWNENALQNVYFRATLPGTSEGVEGTLTAISDIDVSTPMEYIEADAIRGEVRMTGTAANGGSDIFGVLGYAQMSNTYDSRSSNNYVIGVSGFVRVDAGATSKAFGGRFISVITDSAIVTDTYGAAVYIHTAASCAIVNSRVLAVEADYASSVPVTNHYGVHIADPIGAVNPTNIYGLYIESQIAAGTSFNIYSAGTTSKNYFEGSVSVGNAGNTLQNRDGDHWFTSNAYWDGANWQRLDIAEAAFALDLRGKTHIPGESMSGAVLWVATPHANPIGSTFGAQYAWELGWAITEYRDFVIGGAGMEMDGHGTVPYGRVIHSNPAGNPFTVPHTGILTNLFVDFSGRDINADPCWFAGRVDDSFKIRRLAGSAAISDGNFATLFHIDSAGNVVGNLKILTAANSLGWTHTDGTASISSQVKDGHAWIGTGTNHPLSFFVNNSGVLLTLDSVGWLGFSNPSPASRLDLGAGAISMAEMAAPSAPTTSNKAIIYCDDSAGKTRIMVKFYGSETPVQIATQP